MLRMSINVRRTDAALTEASGLLRVLGACFLCATRPDEPLLDETAQAVGIEGHGIVQVGEAIAEGDVPGIGGDGDKDRVALSRQRPQDTSFPRSELGQVARPL